MNKRTPYMLLVLMSLSLIILRFIDFPLEHRMYERALIQGIRMIGAFGLIILLIQSKVKIRKILIILIGVIQMCTFIYYLSPNMTFQMYCMLGLIRNMLWATSFFLVYRSDSKMTYNYIIPFVYLVHALQSYLFTVSAHLRVTMFDYRFWSNVVTVVFILNLFFIKGHVLETQNDG